LGFKHRPGALTARVLLLAWIAISMAYYVAGVAALREKWFHAEQHGHPRFGVTDDGRLSRLRKSDRDKGLAEGDVIETLK
jgi:hypothetical protein